MGFSISTFSGTVLLLSLLLSPSCFQSLRSPVLCFFYLYSYPRHVFNLYVLRYCASSIFTPIPIKFSISTFSGTVLLSIFTPIPVMFFHHNITQPQFRCSYLAGSDDITTEMLKPLDENDVTLIHELCNQIHISGRIPKYTNQSVFVQFKKKPKATRCT